MTLSDLAITALILLGGILVWRHLNVSRTAYRYAKKRTSDEGVLLLDQTVILKRVFIKRSKHSLLCICRQYQFEFASLGDVRYQGEIVCEGSRITGFAMQAHKHSNQEHTPLH